MMLLLLRSLPDSAPPRFAPLGPRRSVQGASHHGDFTARCIPHLLQEGQRVWSRPFSIRRWRSSSHCISSSTISLAVAAVAENGVLGSQHCMPLLELGTRRRSKPSSATVEDSECMLLPIPGWCRRTLPRPVVTPKRFGSCSEQEQRARSVTLTARGCCTTPLELGRWMCASSFWRNTKAMFGSGTAGTAHHCTGP